MKRLCICSWVRPGVWVGCAHVCREAVCACGNNHCGSEAGNCGVVDVRFAFSRERGKPGSIYYVPTATGRDAVIPLGRNTCFNSACGWCHADGDRTLERTAWDTSQIYSIPGLYTPAATLGGEGGGVLVYYNGSPWAHGQTFGVVRESCGFRLRRLLSVA